jgi:hypothetical protein
LFGTLACRIGFRYLHLALFLTAGGSVSLKPRELNLIRFRSAYAAQLLQHIIPLSLKSSHPYSRCGSAVLSASVTGGVRQFNDVEVANLQRQRRVVISLILKFRACSELLYIRST